MRIARRIFVALAGAAFIGAFGAFGLSGPAAAASPPIYAVHGIAIKGYDPVAYFTEGKPVEGRSVTLAVGEAPAELLKIALKAANLIGDGFYGVDLKQVGERYYVVEVNDNPSVDAGVEDEVLRDALYREIMGTIVRRIEERKRTR